MPRSHRPRKRYVPKRIELDPVEATIARAAVMPRHAAAPFIAAMQTALDGLRRGCGGMKAWADLADALNVAESLADLRIANDHRATILAGQRALAELHARHGATASWTLRADELRALAAAEEIAEIQLGVCTQGEFVDAVSTTTRRVAGALAGNASPSAIVCVAGGIGAA